jgi:hypothetical protein
MKFVKVDYMPERGRCSKKPLKLFLEEFMSRNIKTAKVELIEGDYKNPAIARRCISTAAKKHYLPIKAGYRDKEVYIYRTDM